MARTGAAEDRRLETCTHRSELLGPAVTALFQTMC
jgi:hypothetical protein